MEIKNNMNDKKLTAGQLYIPFWKKSNLTLQEASAYFGIGVNRIREITDRNNCNFVLFVGNKRLIKREGFEKFLNEAYVV